MERDSAIGLGCGPLVVGRLSDVLHSCYGDLALRYALIVPCLTVIAGNVLFWMAARYVARDMAAALD
jgi:cytochrome c oxidase subunit IV